MAPPLLTLKDVRHGFGGQPCLDGTELAVLPRDRICLIGRNGSGKSTLLRIAAGLIEPERGERFVHPGVTMRYLPQEPDFAGFATTRAYAEAGLTPGDDAYRVSYLLEQLGLTGEEDPSRLSGGEARRAALARTLAPEPDLLLLDEPTNHLDLPVIAWLEQELAASKSALVLISHDRRFLESLSRATVWLDRGKARRLDQGFGSFEAWRDKVLEEEELERHKLDRKIANEEHWLRYGVTARRKRNVKRLGNLHALREEARTYRRAQGNITLAVTEADTAGKLMIEAKSIAKSYDGRPIVGDFSIRISRGERVGIVGANGAGKTTLINMLTGGLAPDGGTVVLSPATQLATLDQRRDSLKDEWTLAEAMTDGRGDIIDVAGERKHVMGYLKDFLFTPEQARTPIKVLSGGERGRLMLARALAKPSNLLVLDEPTNDLDLETLDLLQEMIADYSGTVILVSHDRDFLDRTVNAVIMADGAGRFTTYAGGYSDMVTQRGEGVTARKGQGNRLSAMAKGTEPQPAAPVREAKARLTFKDRHALETLPVTINKLHADIAKLNALLAEPGLFETNPARFNKAVEALALTQTRLVEAEEEWLRLELLREEAEA
ncbi:MAG: ABC-F family ATP-binding cassette domain-containing protein [Beijerinckiaceae bacterium]|nr:ABC-F family ATP-binding cassette domain-containing protein [Beijerinckiaceae bacterium]